MYTSVDGSKPTCSQLHGIHVSLFHSLISYTTPYHTSCAGLSCEVCAAYGASVKLIVRVVCFSSFALRNTFNFDFSKQNPAISLSDVIGMDFEN